MTYPVRGVLLTGATGLLGRYLLRDLLLMGNRVAVLARDARGETATDRIRELIDFWSESVGRRLPEPVVLVGDIRSEGLALTASDRRWLSGGCDSVIHTAASLAFRASADGEPWATNVEGTRNLLNLCSRIGLTAFHHVSTAFVCGEAQGPILEDDQQPTRWFRNLYEQSKWVAEQLVRQMSNIRSTIYRPSVIVGDSQTGYTSAYHGVYRFLQLADRLAEPAQRVKAPEGWRRLELRMPLTGDEYHNLVPVDWVAGAIVRLMNRPKCHGFTYHLVSEEPIPARLILEAAEKVLEIEGVRFTDRQTVNDSTLLEQLFLDHLEEYWPYLESDPEFDTRNARAALPDLRPVRIDLPLLTRLFEFAANDRWGRKQRTRTAPTRSPSRIDCREYVEEIFPRTVRSSPLSRAARLNVVVALDVRGSGGGQWTCGWVDGELLFVELGMERTADVVFRTDPATFDDVVHGRTSSQAAFSTRRIEIEGDVEKALKLAVLFSLFLQEGEAPLPGGHFAEAPLDLPMNKEVTDAVSGSF